jgi:hypothetical protein
MLFPRNALAPGPQACFFAKKVIAKVKVGKEFFVLDKSLFLPYFSLIVSLLCSDYA